MSRKLHESEPEMAEALINKPNILTRTTHRVNEHELLKRLECLCQTVGMEFPKEAWPKDDHKAYFLLGVCATEDMKDLSLRERLERLDDWARQRNLLKPNETLFAKKQVKAQQPTFLAKNPHFLLRTHLSDKRDHGSGCTNNVRRRQQYRKSGG
ncbi:MAG: hypothetical protein WAK48_00360 [Candidatus Acidiferrum sp.]|jgi:hypothetical protein